MGALHNSGLGLGPRLGLGRGLARGLDCGCGWCSAMDGLMEGLILDGLALGWPGLTGLALGWPGLTGLALGLLGGLMGLLLCSEGGMG